MRSLPAVIIASILVGGCASSKTTVVRLDEPEHVYVCHGNKKAHWIRVAEPAAKAHRRHGDVVVVSNRMPRVPCRR